MTTTKVAFISLAVTFSYSTIHDLLLTALGWK